MGFILSKSLIKTMQKLVNLITLILVSSLCFPQSSNALSFNLKEKESTGSEIVIQNSGNFDAASATLGIRQKPGGKFVLKVRVPKVNGKVVRVTVKIPDEFTPHVKVKNKIFKAKRKKNNIVFFMKIKKSINKLIPTGSLIDIPVTLTDLQNNAEEEFILEVRD